jgi:5-methylcytosine-specific restriction endonuclease McrA
LVVINNLKGKGDSSMNSLTVYNKTKGYCWYCGRVLNINALSILEHIPEDRRFNNGNDSYNFTIDHVIRKNNKNNNIDNLVPCCKSCNSTKGTKDVEHFRGLLQNRIFKEKYGVVFNNKQKEFLKDINVDLPIEEVTFYFEEKDLLNKRYLGEGT